MDNTNPSVFPEPTTEEESVFQDVVQAAQEYPEEFKANIAERYSFKQGKSYDEVKATVDSYGPESAATVNTPSTNNVDFLTEAMSKNFDSNTFLKTYQDRQKQNDDIANAGVSADVVSDIYDNADLSKIPVVQRSAIASKILQDEFNAVTPDKGAIGTTVDFLGYLSRTMTYGVVERGMGTGEKTGYDYYSRMMNAKSMAEMRQIAKEAAQESNNKGLIGGNILQQRLDQQAILLGGQSLGEKYEFGVDIATLIPLGSLAKVARIGKTADALVLTGDAIDTTLSLKGLNAGDQALAHALNNEVGSAELIRHAAPADHRVAAPNVLSLIGPSRNPVDSFEEYNKAASILQNIHVGTLVTEEEAATRALKMVEDQKIHTKLGYRQHEVVDLGNGNFELNSYFGKGTGEVFTNLDNATREAKRLGGEVLSVGTDEYVIKISNALDTTGITTATASDELRSGIIRNHLSPELTSAERHLTDLKVGLEKVGVINRDIAKPFQKAMDGLGRFNGERVNFGSLIDEYHNSPRVTPPSVDEFKADWYSRTGTKASDKVVKAYESLIDYSNGVKWLEADGVKKSHDASGVKIINVKGYGEVKASFDTTASGNIQVYDLSTGKFSTAQSIKKSGKPIFELAEERMVNDMAVKYATGDVLGSRPIAIHDVASPVVFGPRRTTSKYFIKQDRKIATTAGDTIDSAPRIIFGGRSEKEVNRALNEIKAVMQRVSAESGMDLYDKASKGKYLTKADLSQAMKANSQALNEFIAKTITFDNSIETLDDFLKMMDETGLDFGDLQVVSAGEAIGKTLPLNKGVARSTTYSELYRLQHNTFDKRFKTLKPSGFEDFSVDPIVAMQRDFTRGINDLTTRTYRKRASEGLVNGAKDHSLNYDRIKNSPLMEQVNELRIDTSTVAGQRYAQEQRVIQNMLGSKSEFTKRWEHGVQKIQEYIFDKTGKEIKAIDYLSSDPIVALRGLAFHLKMGLFNVDQFLMQSSQALNIMALSPKYGMSAAASYLPVRFALMRNNPAITKTIAKRFAALSGMTEEQFIEKIDYIMKSGRMEIGRDIVEYSGAEDFSYGIWKKGLDKSTVFFKEGERMPRAMAIHVAYREFKADPKFATVDVKTKNGFAIMDNYITRRADALTANMTSVSAASWQKGFPSLMFQWQSYFARNMEQIFFGRNLSVGERVRLASSQLFYFGLAGTGAGYFYDRYMADKEPIDPNLRTLIRYGTIDFLLGEITGVRTAISSRMAMGESIWETARNLQEDGYLKTLGGPSVGIASDFISQSLSVLKAVATGEGSLAAFDGNKLLMNVSSFARGSKALHAIQTGELVTKSGRVMATDVSPMAGKLYWVGTPLQEEIATYTANDILKDRKTLITDVAKRYKELNQAGFKKAEEGDMTSAKDLHQQALDLLIGMNLKDVNEVLRQAKPDLLDGFTSTILRLQKAGQYGMAEQIRLMKEGETK